MPDDNSPWKTLRFGELKCLIALEANDLERALDFARWTVLFNQTIFSLDRLRFYQCLVKVLECKLDENLKLDDYSQALELIYGTATFNEVMAHLNHEHKFFGLSASDLELSNFKAHQELLKVYALIKNAHITPIEA